MLATLDLIESIWLLAPDSSSYKELLNQNSLLKVWTNSKKSGEDFPVCHLFPKYPTKPEKFDIAFSWPILYLQSLYMSNITLEQKSTRLKKVTMLHKWYTHIFKSRSSKFFLNLQAYTYDKDFTISLRSWSDIY